MSAVLPRVGGVLLAAGGSTRLGGGRLKQLLTWDGEPMVRRAAREALTSQLAELVVVLGARAGEVNRALDDLALRTVVNEQWQSGQSSSVRTGLASLAPGAAAALFLPCDQPYLTHALLDLLIDAHRETRAPIVVPSFAGQRGSPTLFASHLFPELAALTGDAGGRQILEAHRNQVLEVPLRDRRALIDIDTWEEFELYSRGGAEG